jgi:fructokinase
VIAGYLGQLAASIALMTSVERIVFGGGVMASADLLARVRTAALGYLNGYLAPLRNVERAAGYICAPALGGDAGIVGSLLLAMRARKLRDAESA